MEERIARLEVHTGHLQEDIKRIEHKIDNRIEPKIDALGEKVEALRDALFAFQLETRESFAKLQLETMDSFVKLQLETREGFAKLQLEAKDNLARLMNSRWSDKVWWLVIAGALLGVMARGFKWI
jgi:hypothetical protein